MADTRYPQGPAYTGTPTEGPAPQASPMCCSSSVNVPPLSHTEPPLHRVRGTQPGPPGPGPRSAHPHVQRTLEGTHSTYSCTPGHVPAQATRQRPGTPGEGDGCRALASPSRSILSADRGGDGPAPAWCRPWGTELGPRGRQGGVRAAEMGQKVARPRSRHNPRRSRPVPPGWSERPIPGGVEEKLQGPRQRRGRGVPVCVGLLEPSYGTACGRVEGLGGLPIRPFLTICDSPKMSLTGHGDPSPSTRRSSWWPRETRPPSPAASPTRLSTSCSTGTA